METEEIRKLAKEYYSRKDIQKSIIEFSKNREVVPKYLSQFGKRPDTVNYENDILALVNKGVTSFHSSEELWRDPLELSTEMTEEKVKKLRKGWDLILDIDCKFVEYSKIAAELLIEALKFNGVKNIGIKYSGNKGFHIGISFDAFPENIQDMDIKDFFPDGPRIIAVYLADLIKKYLSEKILEITTLERLAASLGKKKEDLMKDGEFNPYSILDIDTILISPRHLFRMPYSLHEKTGLASIVITPKQLKDFHPSWAKPHRVIPKPFLPVAEKDEAKKLLLQALDWNSQKQRQQTPRLKLEREKRQTLVMGEKPRQEIVFKDVKEEFFPPCVKKALLGMKDDGRKRAVFVLINFFRSLGLSMEEIENRLGEWNKLNYKLLKDGYISSQLTWYKKQKSMLPPNCDKQYYKGIGICSPDFFCQRIRNPIYYVKDRLREANRQKEAEENKRVKKTRKAKEF